MVFTEFAALVQSRWLLLIGGDKRGDAGVSADRRKKKPPQPKTRGGGKKVARGRSRGKAPPVEPEGKMTATAPPAKTWTKGSAEDKAMMNESLIASSPDASEGFAESVGSTGGYSTVDEDEELQSLLRRRSSLVGDPVERACADAAAAAGALEVASKAPTMASAAAAAAPKALGSPTESVATEPEEDDEVLLLRDSGYSTFDEEEEAEAEEPEALEELQVEGLRESEQWPLVEIHERVDVDAVRVKTDELLPVSPAAAAAQSLLAVEVTAEEDEEDEEDEYARLDLAHGEDMFGQSTTPMAKPATVMATPTPTTAPATATAPAPPAAYCPGGVPDEYVGEIYANLRAREPRYHVTSDYFAVQPSVQPKMRAALVDWLVEVHQRFELEPQTLFLAVNYVDRYLANMPVHAPRLQLVGVTALLIASKFEEIYPCDMDDLLYICDRMYTHEDLIDCERSLLNTFRFELAGPTANSFLDLFLHSLEETADDKLLAHLAAFLAEASLLDFSFTAAHPPSKVAAASLLAAFCFVENQPPSLVWNFRRQELTGYALEELAPCARALWQSAGTTLRAPDNELLASSNKFAAEELGQVALLPLDDLDRLLA